MERSRGEATTAELVGAGIDSAGSCLFFFFFRARSTPMKDRGGSSNLLLARGEGSRERTRGERMPSRSEPLWPTKRCPTVTRRKTLFVRFSARRRDAHW